MPNCVAALTFHSSLLSVATAAPAEPSPAAYDRPALEAMGFTPDEDGDE